MYVETMLMESFGYKQYESLENEVKVKRLIFVKKTCRAWISVFSRIFCLSKWRRWAAGSNANSWCRPCVYHC